MDVGGDRKAVMFNFGISGKVVIEVVVVGGLLNGERATSLSCRGLDSCVNIPTLPAAKDAVCVARGS
jgi:hypothetical protein